MGIFTEGITVECPPGGTPVRLWWRGECWSVGPEPLCWYERRPWWERETRVPPGEGVGVVDTRIWRLQVKREGDRGRAGVSAGLSGAGHSGAGTDDAGWLTLDVVQQRPGGQWRVIKIHDAVDDVFKEHGSA